MKKTLLSLATVALGVLAANAATVEINITGATAFRSDAYNAIRAMYTGGVPTSQNPVHPSSANQVTFSGTMGIFGGVSGPTVIVRTSYNGSAEGVGVVANGDTRPFLFSATPGVATLTNMTSDFAFSDVFQSSTDFTSPALEESVLVGFEQKPGIAVIPFVWTRGNTCTNTVVNITAQNARALTGVGYLPLYLITGNTNEVTSPQIVHLVGRDNGSGTRITTLSEIGLGPLPIIGQRRSVNGFFVPDPIGFSSGSFVRTNLNSAATSIQGPGGAISYLAPADSAITVTGGGAALTYDGVAYTKDAVRSGKYTMWGFEHLYSQPIQGSGSDEETFRDAFVPQIDALLPSSVNAIQIGSMFVTRPADGAVVTP